MHVPRLGPILAVALVPAALHAGPASGAVQFSRVAVVVFPANDGAQRAVASAQARIEEILLDNGVNVIDRDQSEDIKSIWKKLEDPGYFITADDFVKNTQKHQVDGLVRMYLSADVQGVMEGFFSATAQVDLRLVDEDAQVDAKTSFPMGAPGRPPSDGLTEQAAVINAVQRAVDEAAQSLGLTVAAPASPRAMLFRLEGPVEAPGSAAPQPRPPRDLKADYVSLAQLASGRNTGEEVTCAERAPGGDVGVVGGSIHSMARGPRGLEMHFGSRMHLVDLAQEREITVFDTRVVGRKPKEHRGSSDVLDCLFIHSWRYLAAVTGDVLSLWDTERGLQLAEVLLPFGTDEATLEVLRDPAGLFLRVRGEGKHEAVYRLAIGGGRAG